MFIHKAGYIHGTFFKSKVFGSLYHLSLLSEDAL